MYFYFFYDYDDIEKQMRDVLQNPDISYDFTPPEFEDFVAEVFRRNGYEVTLTKRTHDGGKDIVARYAMAGGVSIDIYIECKKRAKDRPVDVSVVRAAYGTQIADKANKSVIVTTSHFTKEARNFAEKNSIQLMDFDAFMEMLRNTPINQNFT